MALSAGAIALDLGLNTAPISTQVKTAAKGVQKQLGSAFKGINTQVNSTANFAQSKLGSAFKKIGAIIGSAFAVQKLLVFGQECINLGSDLEEVENVVDTAFPSMEARVDSFASSCIESFGMSTKVAKQYLGTFGAMSKSFGFTEEQAFSMSSALTGLAGDVASFYNISTDLAYTKLKSVFSGETETLKDLGVVMTQAALDQYALANGYGKTTAKMTEQEKVALRFAFVQEQLSIASGDFIKTQNSWANQTRILKLRFDELKGTIGSGLIAALSPVLQIINAVLARINSLANAIKSLFSVGKKGSSTSKAVGEIASESSNAESAASGAGKALKSLMGFDQINRLDSSSGGGGGSSELDIDLGDTSAELDETDAKMSALIERLKEISDLFKQGFKIGFSSADLDAITQHAESAKQSLIEIFSSDEVRTASHNFADEFALSFGKITGSLGSVGATIAENLAGGFDLALQQRGGDIRQSIANAINAESETAAIGGDLAVALAEGFSAFKSEGGKEISAAIMSMLADAGTTARETCSMLGRDVMSAISRPFIENSGSIKEEIEKLLSPVGKILSLAANGFHKFCETVKIGYNSFIKPALDEFGKKLSSLWNEHLQPLWNEVSGLLSRLGDLFSAAWEKAQPFIQTIQFGLSILGQLLQPVMSLFGDAILDGLGQLADAFTAIFGILNGLLDFVTGVFSGDWNKAWEGIKYAAGSLWDYIKSRFKSDTIVKYFSDIWDKVKSKFSAMGTQIGSSMASAIKSAINSCINQIQSKINSGIGIINKALSIVPGSPKLSTVSLPRLAQGGYVKANTPQLAMIGDNRRYGEIVAPEDKMLEMILTALKMFKQQESGGSNTSAEAQIIELVVNIGDENLIRRVIKLLKEENRRNNQLILEL